MPRHMYSLYAFELLREDVVTDCVSELFRELQAPLWLCRVVSSVAAVVVVGGVSSDVASQPIYTSGLSNTVVDCNARFVTEDGHRQKYK
jgi:hypothetical protein